MRYVYHVSLSPIHEWQYKCIHLTNLCNVVSYNVAKGKQRENAINYLISCLPNGMLKRDGDELVFNGGWDKYNTMLAERIAKTASDSISDGSDILSKVNGIIANPLGIDAKFVLATTLCNNYMPLASSELISKMKSMGIGDSLYIGEIAEYHEYLY